MATTDADAAESEMWDDLSVSYEHAYQRNPLKTACVREAVSLLQPGSRVLDIGCGTGVPVALMLADANMDVHGCDIAPGLVQLAQQRVPAGRFVAANMIDYQPHGKFAAIFIIY